MYTKIALVAYGLSIVYTKAMLNASSVLLKILRKKLDFKPFNCPFCLSIWLCFGISSVLYFTTFHSVKVMLINFLVAAGLTTFLNKLTGY
jgi:hypothetical protein